MNIYYFHSIFGIFSLILGILVLASYFFIYGLRKPPGMLILWQTILQVILDIEWGIVGFYKIILSESISELSCWILGTITIYCFFVNWNYNLCLIAELIIKLKDPMNGNYKKRAYFYHITSHILGLGFTIMAAIRGDAGESLIITCFIKRNSNFVLLILPLCFYYPVVIIGVVFCSTLINPTTSKLVKSYVLVYFISLVVYTLVWILITTVMIIDDNKTKLDLSTELVGSFSGVIINTLRIADPALWNYVKSRIRRPKRKNTLTLLDTTRVDSVYESSYIQMFCYIFNTAVLKSVISLNLVMNSEHETEENLVAWSSDHYNHKQFLKFDKEDIKEIKVSEKITESGNLYAVNRYKCLAKVYAPLVFIHIRTSLDITNEIVAESFDLVRNVSSIKTNAGNEGGKSASFLYFSSDKNFIIKTISKNEKKTFMSEILTDYHKHITVNQDSVLSRIIGIFRFTFEDNTKSRILLQLNIFPDVSLIEIFDLKGSKLDRTSFGPNEVVGSFKSNKIYKDLDFINSKKTLLIEEIDLQRFKNSIFKDSEFLNAHNIIDYSLLLGISHDYNYLARPLTGRGKDKGLYFYAGIIDYLQTYNTFKQLEAFSKNLIMINVPKEDISIIPSKKYRERFTNFISSILPGS